MADILKTCEQATEEKITWNSKCERNHSTGSHNQGKKPKQNETKVKAKLKNLSKREVKDMKLMLRTFVTDKTPRRCQV